MAGSGNINSREAHKHGTRRQFNATNLAQQKPLITKRTHNLHLCLLR